MKAIHLLVAFCGLMGPGSAIRVVEEIDDVFLDSFNPEIEKELMRVDGLTPHDLQGSINVIKNVRDGLRDAELPSPFWPYEQALLGILDDLWYELRAAFRESQLEVEALRRAGPKTTENGGRMARTSLNRVNTDVSPSARADHVFVENPGSRAAKLKQQASLTGRNMFLWLNQSSQD